jgi:hypothetical protein
MNKQSEIQRLLILFHDFEIVDLKFSDSTLHMLLEIPWGELWDELDYRIHLKLNEVYDFVFNFSTQKSGGSIKANTAQESQIENLSSTNPEEILNLKLSIQSYRFTIPTKHTLFCRSYNGAIAAELDFTATGYQLLDKEGNDLFVEKMEEWAKLWGDSL